MESGIYKIVCNATQGVYIGQSIDVYRRWETHLRDLRNNKHCNKLLQGDFLKYGEISFDFSIVSLCEPEVLDLLEVYYIKKYKKEGISYNLTKSGTGRHKEKPVLTMDEYKEIIKFRQENVIINDKDLSKILEILKKLRQSDLSRRCYLDDILDNKLSFRKYVFTEGDLEKSFKKVKEVLSLSQLVIIDYIIKYMNNKYSSVREILDIAVDFNNLKIDSKKILLNCTVKKTGETFIKELYI